jgi:hypothetical protein
MIIPSAPGESFSIFVAAPAIYLEVQCWDNLLGVFPARFRCDSKWLKKRKY